MQQRFLAVSVCLVAALSAVRPVAALEKEVLVEKPGAKPENGWDGILSIGASVSFANARGVVGTVDGNSLTLGANITGELNYFKGVNDWRNTAKLIEMFSYGPPIKKMVKSSDQFVIETIYYYHIPTASWLGPYARVRLDTSLFESADYRAAPTSYQVIERNGTAGTPTRPRTQFKLTDSFAPLTLKEGVGMFARPVELEAAELEFRLGLGSTEVFADGILSLADDPTTPWVEVKKLASYQQVGGEVAVVLQGLLASKKVSYKAYAEAMTPFARSKESGDHRSGWKMTNFEAGAKISFKLVAWASLDYELKVLRLPQLLDVFQIQNNLLLTFKYVYTPPQPPAPAPAPAAPAK